jgi:diguanylate cyclase (GGDEF)-like protein
MAHADKQKSGIIHRVSAWLYAHRIWGFLHAWLQDKGPITLGGLCLSLVGLIGLFDLLTGHELSSFVFYFIPVSVAAWYAGRRIGLIVSTTSALTWFTADLLTGETFSHPAVHIWNAGVSFVAFVIVTQLIAQLALALKLARMATLDPLTNLLNRRSFHEEGERLLALAVRHGHCATVAYVDVDDFKRVNDHLGHHVGDRLLRLVGARLMRAVRSSDLVGRQGGDEFVLFLPQTDYAGAQAVAGNIHDALSSVHLSGQSQITFSIGVATFTRAPTSLDAAVKAADDLMYRAKVGGKNATIHESVNM